MLRKVTKIVIYVVTVLTTYLVTGFIEEKTLTEAERFRPVLATLLGMAMIAILFIPVFGYMERVTEAVVTASLRTTKGSAGRIMGVIAFVIVTLVLLFAVFLNRWFGMSLTDLI